MTHPTADLQAIRSHIEALVAAVNASDPKVELLVRIGDIHRLVSVALATPSTAVGRVIEEERKVVELAKAHRRSRKWGVMDHELQQSIDDLLALDALALKGDGK